MSKEYTSSQRTDHHHCVLFTGVLALLPHCACRTKQVLAHPPAGKSRCTAPRLPKTASRLRLHSKGSCIQKVNITNGKETRVRIYLGLIVQVVLPHMCFGFHYY